jgi:hypothetical protein
MQQFWDEKMYSFEAKTLLDTNLEGSFWVPE